MPEETKPMLTFSKVARKAYLYKNEKKREGSRDPDYKGKVFDLDLSKLKEIANEDGIIETLHLSGWIEEDQSGTSRVGIAVQKGVPQDGEAAVTEPAKEPAEAPF
jgi:hypothetical protein